MSGVLVKYGKQIMWGFILLVMMLSMITFYFNNKAMDAEVDRRNKIIRANEDLTEAQVEQLVLTKDYFNVTRKTQTEFDDQIKRLNNISRTTVAIIAASFLIAGHQAYVEFSQNGKTVSKRFNR